MLILIRAFPSPHDEGLVKGMQQKQFLAVLAAGLLLCPTVLLGSLDEADQPRQHMFS